MQKRYVLIFFFLLFKLSAQIGINTNTPSTTFQVVGSPDDPNTVDGIIAPRLKLSELFAKRAKYGIEQKGTIVYVNNIDEIVTNLTVPYKYITVEGYYFFDGETWKTLQDLSGIVLFEISLGDGDGTVARQTFNAGSTATSFNKINLQNITENIGNGTWDNVNKSYEIPLTGTYFVSASVRFTDSSPARDVFINVDSKREDTPSALWGYSNSGKFTIQYSRLGYYRAGDNVSLWAFGQTGTNATTVNIANATLSFLYISSFGQAL